MIIQLKWIKKLGLNGIAIFPFIFIADKNNKRVLKHELVHIEQQKKEWVILFLIKYIYYNLKYGYKNNPYEVAAREREYD